MTENKEKNHQEMYLSLISKILSSPVIKGAFIFFIILTVLIIILISLRPTIPLGPDIYNRDIYILIDQTPSLSSMQKNEIKRKIQKEVIAISGLGDRVFCYQIGSKFDEISDRIFESERFLPKVPDNIIEHDLDKFSDASSLKKRLREDWRIFNQEKMKWSQSVDTISFSGGRNSDYSGALNEIGRRLSNKDDPHKAKDQWLILIGDLKHDVKKNVAITSTEIDSLQFVNTNIWLIYPAGVFKNEKEQASIENQWIAYFKARGNGAIKIKSLGGFNGAFLESSVPKLDVLGED